MLYLQKNNETSCDDHSVAQEIVELEEEIVSRNNKYREKTAHNEGKEECKNTHTVRQREKRRKSKQKN